MGGWLIDVTCFLVVLHKQYFYEPDLNRNSSTQLQQGETAFRMLYDIDDAVF
jgi:hypothetical protein